jgi:hypothetical protein
MLPAAKPTTSPSSSATNTLAAFGAAVSIRCHSVTLASTSIASR